MFSMSLGTFALPHMSPPLVHCSSLMYHRLTGRARLRGILPAAPVAALLLGCRYQSSTGHDGRGNSPPFGGDTDNCRVIEAEVVSAPLSFLDEMSSGSRQSSNIPHPWARNGRVTPTQQARHRHAAAERLTQLMRSDAERQVSHATPGSHYPSEGTQTSTITIAQADRSSVRVAFANDLAEGPSSSGPLVSIEALEQELLDDSHLYFPEVGAAVEGREVAADMQLATPRAYIPGQQIIPPGYTRYRVDVQYQGNDFDGWFKSSSRQWFRTETLPDGTTRRVAVASPQEQHDKSPRHGVSADGMQSQYHARTVLEDALAVALDVPSVSVIAAAIPERGVSVRRLPCHVDIPSDIEMQPRTIIQRATMWLQKRHQPLAILSCHRCQNQDFHARHTGVRRVYCYRILNRVAPPLFDAGLQWHVDRYLDVPRMQRFAAEMEGTRDYGYFADPKMAHALRRAAMVGYAGGVGFSTAAHVPEHVEPSALGLERGVDPSAKKAIVDKGLTNLERAAALPTMNKYGQTVLSYMAKPKEYHKARTNLPTVRTIDKIEVVRQDDEVLIWFVGQSFLRQQIRNMVGVLKASGHGLWDEHELHHAFTTSFEVSRKKFKRERLPPAPAYGLTLWDVEYPTSHRSDHVSFVDAGPYEEVDISSTH